MHLAAQNGHAACFETLLARGAKLNISSKSGHMPIDLADQNGHTACIAILLVQVFLPKNKIETRIKCAELRVDRAPHESNLLYRAIMSGLACFVTWYHSLRHICGL
eukprot:GDKK01047268.1.p1 GENE.GDKK01047268.1~~GDKK01047268.1.p1  ORF type:complete len:106 (-),score=3.78 GDKK01047268.1:21-338(-)